MENDVIVSDEPFDGSLDRDWLIFGAIQIGRFGRRLISRFGK